MTQKEHTKDQQNAQQVPAVQILSQYVKDLSFEAPHMPHVLAEMKTAPAITVDIDVKVNKTPNPELYTVDLHIKANAERADDKKAIFVCELVYGALVAVKLPEDQLEPVLVVEIPHLIFPYARSIVANVTRESGLPPLQINPVDFASLYMQKQQGKAKN